MGFFKPDDYCEFLSSGVSRQHRIARDDLGSLLFYEFSKLRYYNPFHVYCRELALGTVSLTGDRAQGDDSKHDSHYTYKLMPMFKYINDTFKIWTSILSPIPQRKMKFPINFVVMLNLVRQIKSSFNRNPSLELLDITHA